MRPVPLVLLVLSVLPLQAAQPFLERYALAADRAAVLKDLIPGTDDYYFYHALYHQTQGDQARAAALLKQWEEASSGPNGRRDILKNRAALLAYSTDPERTLKWLQEKLALEFNHQRETEEARAELPSVLDPALISFAAFEQKAIAGTEALENVTDAGLYRLTQPPDKWKLTEIRALLSRLKRPDFPGIVGVIHRELNEKDSAFGKFPIHTLLTSDQLAELQKLRPALLNNEAFTAAVMTRMRPTEFEDPERDPAVRGAWLERLWAYASTLNPNANALKANLLYHLLAHDERQGKLDPQRLIAYLKLPRPVRYLSAQYRKDHPELWKFPAALDFDPSAFTGTAPVGDDEALVRRLLIRYLTTEKEDAIAPLISAGFLNSLLAEAKLTTGAPEPQKWMSLLTPEALQSLRERTDIEFDPASRPVWKPDDVVTLDVWLKNTPSLLVRVYEINTANVHRTDEEVNTGLDLDGLTANHEQKREFKDAPILRTKQTFSFPELTGKRGVWIIEFIGNGKASRALIRKGGLRTIVRQTSAGTAVTVLDEKLKPVPQAFAMIGPKQFTADEKGLILLPLSTQPGPQNTIIDDGTGFTALETIELQGEKYELAAGFHVPRESLLPGNKATLLIRPRLQSNGRPVLLEALEKVKVTIASHTLDGTPASVVIPLEKLAEDKETTVEFAVPDRLETLMFELSAEVKSTLTGTPVQLESGRYAEEVNTVTKNGQVSDLHLSQNAGQWVLQCLGLNGEPRPSREVNVTFHREEFGASIEVQMKTDATGSIALGVLEGISILNAATDDADRAFRLPEPEHRLPEVIHLKAGQTLTVPEAAGTLLETVGVPPSGGTGGQAFKALIPPKGGTPTIWPNLPAGTYTLYLPASTHTVRIAPGDIVEGHAVAPTSTVQLTANHPLSVTGMAEGELKLPDANAKPKPALIFHIGNVSPETRVHILTSRFLPEFDAMHSLGEFPLAAPSVEGVSWQPSRYLSSRNIGDEYRYVLERRTAARFAGNMLAKPGLLINPWEIAVTNTEKEQLEDLEKAQNESLLPQPSNIGAAADPAAAEDKPAGMPANQQGQTFGGSGPGRPDLSFLATPAPALLNLRPDKAGNVVIPRAVLGDRQYIRVLAIDRESSVVRDFSLPAAALPPRDLRLARQFNPAQHFSRQNRVSVLEADKAFRFDDALAAQFQAIGHLGAVQQLFFNLTQNPLLNEFSWLLEWKTFDDAKKRALYSQYACHELNFFLQRKDRAFFGAVVQPLLASKRERTFMDDYLLGTDLTRYLAPWPYGRLNALERILLAERMKEEHPTARRMAADWINMQPVNRGRDMFLFETALRGTALIADRNEAEGKVAANFRYDWYFDTNDSPDLLKHLEGSQFFLTTRSSGPEMTLFGTPRVAIFPMQDDTTGMPDVHVTNAANGIVELEYVKRQERGRQGAQTWDDYSPAHTDLNRPEKAAELERFYKRAKGYYDLGQFNEAEGELNKMLAADPNNPAARRQLERMQQKTSDYLKSARDETRLKMLGDVDNLWMSQPGAIRTGKGAELAYDVDGDGKADDFQHNARMGFEYRRYGNEPHGAGGLPGLTAGAAVAPGTGTTVTEVPLQIRNSDFDGTTIDLSLARGDSEMLAKFKARAEDRPVRLFRQQDPTKVWAEQQYYRLLLEAQTADLVPMNRFWRDYALWDGKGGFLSTSVADAAGSFTEMVLALAVLDLPFPGEFKAGKVDTKDNVLTLTPASRLLLFHQDILPAEPDAAGAKLLVSQNFYREGDRFIEQAGEKTDKFVTAEFLTGAVYGCQVVVTNPSSSPQRVDVLFQIPAGALPVKATRRVQSLPVNIEPYRTAMLDFHFYFPEAGKFAHFPVHISRNDKTAASAAAFTFNVVARPTINDPASWDYVSQHGTDNEVLSFLAQHNLYFLDLEKVLWRLQNADFFRRVIAHLKERHHFDEDVWSYAALHNVQPFLQEFLQASPLSIQCGPVFEAPVLTVNPVEQQSYQHLEYSPLINARAHSLGGERRILNDKFAAQWNALMTVLSFRARLSAEDQLAVAGYLAAQDRIEDALAAFAKVDRASVAEKLQYEYLRAWLAMCQEDTATARRIASALLAHPVKHWRDKFAILTAQLNELEGKPMDPSVASDPSDRDATQNALADKEPSLMLTSESNMVKVRFRNVEEVVVRYYPVDLEFLFSASPFVTQDTGRIASIRPAHSERIMLPAGKDEHTWALPARFHSDNVLVEVEGGGVSKATAVYANDLDVQISESFGQLTVQHDKKPLPKTYVKVFADVNGAPAFYKDGYTDLRGKFDYASLSTDDLNGARRFSILVMSENHGAVVKEVQPPAR
jgi:hypothetical protein